MIIYEFLYCSCIHESSYATMSLHRTKEGAEKAMKKHKIERRVDHDKLIEFQLNECKEYYDKKLKEGKESAADIQTHYDYMVEHYTKEDTFGAHEDWQIGEQELLD